MESTTERLGESTVRLTVTASEDEVEEAVTNTYAEIAKKLRVPGFRKGKVPRPLIDTHVGRGAVLAEALETLVSDTYKRAVEAEDLRPVDSPDVGDLGTLVPGQSYTYSAEVAIRPQFALSSIEGLAVTVPPRKADEREIDAEIEHMRDRFATIEPVTVRGVGEGDFALISFVGKVDGEEYEGNTVDKYLYELGRGTMPGEFDEQLLGTRAGEEAHVAFVVPETSGNAEFVGKEATFDVTVHEVKAKILPDLDDGFAATVGGFDTLAELREDIRGKLDASKEAAYDLQVERAARAALAERAGGEVPQAMVTSRRDAMLRDFMNGLESRGMKLEDYVRATGVEPDRIAADIEERARLSLREELALEALARELALDVTDTDVDLEIAEMAGNQGDLEEMRAKWEELDLIPALRDQALLRKATRWLLEHVEVTEGRPDLEREAPKAAGRAKAPKGASRRTKKTKENAEE